MTQRGTEKDFSDRLKSARKKAGLDQPPPSPAPPLGLASYAFRLATELVEGVIAGGGVGWAIDRVAHGAVVDYLDLHAFGRHFFVFNVADAAINIGVALLILDLLPISGARDSRNEESPRHGAS